MIFGKIDVNKIDKDKLFKGEKGTYLDIVIIETPNSEYSDYMIKQSTKKDEDDIILGNAKNYRREDPAPTPQDPSSGLPF